MYVCMYVFIYLNKCIKWLLISLVCGHIYSTLKISSSGSTVHLGDACVIILCLRNTFFTWVGHVCSYFGMFLLWRVPLCPYGSDF